MTVASAEYMDEETAITDIKHLECPISFVLMTDPVILEDGFTYQKEAIQ